MNNSTDAAGSVLYGGAIDNCGLDVDYSGKVFDKLVHYEADNTASSISSDPFCICLCKLNNHPNCRQSMKTLSVYPGETFQVSGHCWSEKWNSSCSCQKSYGQRQTCKFSIYSTDN